METRRIKIEDLPDLLSMKSGLNLTKLSKELGVTQATLNNWKSGLVKNISYDTREKLAKALEKNQWGFRINKFIGSDLEIFYVDSPVTVDAEISYLNDKVATLQGLINKLISENFTLKEKLENYEVKK